MTATARDDERRNHYRVLYVQPEAPIEVIRAAYRALMSTLRAHPDLGGDPRTAAQLNAAWNVLSDPEARRRYDAALRKPRNAPAAPGSTPAAQGTPDPATWLADRACPLCRHRLAAAPRPGLRCPACDAPLTPAPGTPQGNAELVGRRQAQRFVRDSEVWLRLSAHGADQAARLRDLSFTGLALTFGERLARGMAVRVISPQFDAVAKLVACRALPTGGYSVHGQLLTLELLRTARGVYVDNKV